MSKFDLNRREFLGRSGTAAGLAALGSIGMRRSSEAQEKYPARDVTWLIYQAPGGSLDATARIIQPFLDKAGVKTSLEYALGAGGRIARTKLYTARPDGYLIMTESAPGGSIDEVLKRGTYRASEFIPLYGWSVVSWQICVKKDSPLRTFADLANECKKRRVVIGTIGRGGSSHIQLAALQRELKLPFDMVHFDGSGKAYPAVLGGHVDAVMSGPGSGARMRDSLHFVAVTGEVREPALPDTPTLKEQGFTVTPIDQMWFAQTTPKVPADRIAILASAFEKAFQDKLLFDQMAKAGEFPKLLTGPEVLKRVAQQTAVIENFKDIFN